LFFLVQQLFLEGFNLLARFINSFLKFYLIALDILVLGFNDFILLLDHLLLQFEGGSELVHFDLKLLLGIVNLFVCSRELFHLLGEIQLLLLLVLLFLFVSISQIIYFFFERFFDRVGRGQCLVETRLLLTGCLEISFKFLIHSFKSTDLRHLLLEARLKLFEEVLHLLVLSLVSHRIIVVLRELLDFHLGLAELSSKSLVLLLGFHVRSQEHIIPRLQVIDLFAQLVL